MKWLKKGKLFYFLLAFLLVLVLGGRYWHHAVRGKNKSFSLSSVVRKDLTKKVSVSGQVAAEEAVTLRFKTSGRLSWVGVKEGQKVKKWQAIATLDQRELKKKFQKEMNDYLITRENWEQTQDDYKDYRDRLLLTDEMKRILNKAQWELDNAVLDLEIADLAVKYATLYSPIDGIVTRVETPVAGVNITPAQAEFDIVNPQSVYFQAKVEEMDVAWVKEGQKAILVLDAYPDQIWEGEVKEIAFTASNVSGGKVYLTKISLPENKENRFRLGMSGDGEILVAAKKGILVVPRDALMRREKDYVWLVEEGRAHRQEVKVGLVTDEEAEIKSGLEEGDIIIARGVTEVKEGQVVKN